MLGLALLPALLPGAPQLALKVPVDPQDKLLPQAAFVAALLKKGGTVYFRLPAGASPSRDAQGQWQSETLQAALRSQGALALGGDTESAGAGLNVDLEPVAGPEGRWLSATGLPNIVLIENSSTVSPLSKGLDAWKWPYKAVSFADVEADPHGILDASRSDLVVFSSPGWWDDFANPPGGPSRLPKPVAEALRNFVRQGGSALFIDIAQWDLEKAWPKTLSLDPLGPYQVSKLKLEGGPTGNVSLAPVGVATDRLRSKGAFGLLGSDAFAFPDGGKRQLYAAYAMPDPGGGQGWVAGLALHVFEQDETLAARIRRLFLNLALLSGSRRLSVTGEPTVLPLPLASPVPAASATAIPTLAPNPLPTKAPSPAAVPLVAAAALPTPFPTQVIKPQPSPVSVPTSVASTPVAYLTKQPSPLPMAVASATAVASKARALSTLLSRLPTLVPTRVPVSPPPTPKAAQSTPEPSPVLAPKQGPTIKPEAGVHSSLGCLASAPEPFAEGGVYLQFCLRRSAQTQVTVFDAKGRALWHSPSQSLGAGNHQVFFDGRVSGRFIVPGRYLWEVRAQDASGRAESRQESLTRRAEKRS
jgi:hypothetical protein